MNKAKAKLELPKIDEAVEKAGAAVVDWVFETFAASKDERVRGLVDQYHILALKPFLGPVIAHFVSAKAQRFYEIGYLYGAAVHLASNKDKGERSIVTAYDELGRIREMVKLPLSLAERLELEAKKLGPKD